jgi:hypothetical protein
VRADRRGLQPSVAREASAQGNVNTVAAIVAAGLGLPALVLSLYGADAYLRCSSSPGRFDLALAVAAGALLGAGRLVAHLPGPAQRLHRVLDAQQHRRLD